MKRSIMISVYSYLKQRVCLSRRDIKFCFQFNIQNNLSICRKMLDWTFEGWMKMFILISKNIRALRGLNRLTQQ